MEEKYKNIIIDSTKHSYCFNLGMGDCYKLASGRCTFELTELEYLEEQLKCEHPTDYKGRVGYCRDVYDSMSKDNAFTKSTGIRAFRNACGHIGVSQGQHRTCIAKKNNIEELYFDYLGDNEENLCRACFLIDKKDTKKRLFWDLFKKGKKESNQKGTIDITDDNL